jgi:uncharacterized protein YcbX
MSATVTALSITPVKATRLRHVPEVRVDAHGVRENRRFFLIDEQNEMVNASHLGALTTIVSEYSDEDRWLSLTFPGGGVLADRVQLGATVTARFYGETRPVRLVLGDWSAAISRCAGKALRLVEADETGAVDRGASGVVTLISRGSLGHLAERAQQPAVDARRFRMLIEVDGIAAHEEDAWVGRELQVGEAVLRGRGHVGRCVITSRHPETGDIDLPTLKILGGYRRVAETTEPVAFGIYGEVVRPGTIRLGDPVKLDRG